MYLVLGGWLDGRAGLAWCTLQAFYEYLIVLKAEEMQHPEWLGHELKVPVDADFDNGRSPQTAETDAVSRVSQKL